MKKNLIIAICCLTALFAACKKPVEPVVDHSSHYVGQYVGPFTLTITTINSEPVSSMTFPIDSITMQIAKGGETNAIVASMAIENETYQAKGTASADKADFENVHLVIDKPDQHYKFNLDLKMEGAKSANDTLVISGSFTGNGEAFIFGQQQIFNEVSGTVSGNLNTIAQ